MSSTALQVHDLPPPPPGRAGFPWTEGTPPLPATLPDGSDYPKISVVTPSYQQAEFLEETIRSVLLQGYPNLEYIVMDGGSKDNSVEIIQKYAPFLVFWASEKDTGQANAINKAFALSTGEIMGWLNSDDLLLPGALGSIARAFAEQPQINFVTGLRKTIDKASNVTSNWIRDNPNDFYVRHYCCVAQETTYWRRAAWEKLGPLDESLQFALDYEYWLRAIASGDTLHFIPQFTGGFRDYSENKTNSWGHVYTRDMNTLYQRYNMGKNEAEIHARLGARWARRYGFYVAISQQKWTDSPRRVQLTWRVLELPIICDLILVIWRIVSAYRDSRSIKQLSPPAAFFSALKHALGYFIHAWVARNPAPSDDVADVRTLPNFTETATEVPFPTDTVALGKGWFSPEYQREYFRWCDGSGEFFLLNPTGQPISLSMTIAPSAVSAEFYVEVVDESEIVLTKVSAHSSRLQVTFGIQPQPGNFARYFLRWHGDNGGENSVEKRRLAFRLLGAHVSYRQDDPPMPQNHHEAFQETISQLVSQPATTIPVVGTFIKGLRRLKASQQTMEEQFALWQTLSDDLDYMEEKVQTRKGSQHAKNAQPKSSFPKPPSA